MTTPLNYAYSGRTVSYTAPYNGEYTLEVWGAEGGNRGGAALGGKGGYSTGKIDLLQGDVLYVVVGGNGTSANGYNGGGYAYWGGYGGGATDIRKGSSGLANRIIVAGGGGSVGASNKAGGYGGGATGESRTDSYGSGGAGATQSSGGDYRGTLGSGGSGNSENNGRGGGGGGGYYGGGGVNNDSSADDDRGGGGGSGYIGGMKSGASMKSGNLSMVSPSGTTVVGNSGNGYARITPPPLNIINVKTDKSLVLTRENITVTWGVDGSPSATELARYVFDIEIYQNFTWVRLATSVVSSVRTYTHLVPVDVSNTSIAQFRIGLRLKTATVHNMWVNSNYFSIARRLFLIQGGNKVYRSTIYNLTEVATTSTLTKALFIAQGTETTYWATDDLLETIDKPIKVLAFTNLDVIPIADVTVPAYKPIYMLHDKHGDDIFIKANATNKSGLILNKTANPHGQLFLQKEDILLNAPTAPKVIRRITFNNKLAGASTILNRKLVISVNGGGDFFKWDSSLGWVNIGEINNTPESLKKVKTEGNTLETLNARSEGDWTALFGKRPRKIRIAAYLEQELFSDTLTVDDLTFRMDVTGSWRKAKGSDHMYSYPKDGVMQIELYSSGHYKINY